MSELPAAWSEVSVAEVSELVRGVTFKKAEASQEPGPNLVPVIRAGNIQDGSLVLDSDLIYVPATRVKADQRLRAGDIVIASSSGSLSVVGKSARLVSPWDGAHGGFLTVVRPGPAVDSSYLGYWLQGSHVRRLWSGLAAGTSINNLKVGHFHETAVPLPPLAEQRRIVASVEEHLSHLDAAEGLLRRAQRNLERLREATYRRASHVAGERVRLGDHCRTTSGGTPKRGRSDYYGGDIPWIKSGELGDSEVTTTEERLSMLGLAESSANLVPRGTVLVAMYGATIGKLGKVGFDQAATNQAVAALYPTSGLSVEFLWMVLRGMRGQLSRLGKGGAQPNISQSILRDLAIPLPDTETQAAIVESITRTIEEVDRLAADVAIALRRLGRLKRSILESAFSGRLVSQEPTDGRASP